MPLGIDRVYDGLQDVVLLAGNGKDHQELFSRLTEHGRDIRIGTEASIVHGLQGSWEAFLFLGIYQDNRLDTRLKRLKQGRPYLAWGINLLRYGRRKKAVEFFGNVNVDGPHVALQLHARG